MNAPALPAITETGALGICQLKRLWARSQLARQGHSAHGDEAEGRRDQLTLHALGLGLEQARRALVNDVHSFADFERWIVAMAGTPPTTLAERLNAALLDVPPPGHAQALLQQIDAMDAVLDGADLAHWHREGYVIVRGAVPATLCSQTVEAVMTQQAATLDQPDSWYRGERQGIMVQLFQHPALTAIRSLPRIHKAFAQLWGHADLWPSTDRVSFNPPERPDHPFQGPHLHWDVSLTQPIPFGTQGLIYLTNTSADQGAFTLVPGFHRRIDAWLDALPPIADPRVQDLQALGPRPIAAQAGDLIIWHQALPHGSSPNRATLPRFVHYLNYAPARIEQQAVWR
ncbi:phytanoyl-CoA dioxygenase family protein [Chitinolyticbacter meiyuanensis]|uniref:phytanoyl-CoA dioxygenase family protein n=1 Tax=Chitinolyticbacter meiyuanensis TaxID=682798 RepID=UPI0011E5FAA9|nr:phytanoyl-CoA dioxygenase family protein [Chitinolyticbacter meiyuanensis]